MLTDVERVARALLTEFEVGDRIAIWAPNSADWVILQQAIALAGMVNVAINPLYRANELQYLLDRSGAVALFYVSSYRGLDMDAIVQQIRADVPSLRTTLLRPEWETFYAAGDPSVSFPDVQALDPLQLQYTSGTTGFPKGALLHHKGALNEAYFVAKRAAMNDGVVFLNPMPMYFVGGGVVTELATLAMHGTYLVMPEFDPAHSLELFETYSATHTLMVPTMLLAVMDHPDAQTRDMGSVETIMSGAAAVPGALVLRTMEHFDSKFCILFGQTEMHGVISQTRVTDAIDDQSSTVGQPLPELEIKIADPATGEPVPIGEQGEICCRGYQVMLSYYNMPEETAATIDADGWLHMGDLGTMDDRGFLRVTGRLKDMIIRGGINIYPIEIEESLFSHPDIAQAAVVGIDDEKWGEQVAAVVRLTPAATAPRSEDLIAWCRERMAPYKAPSLWFFVESFPMTTSGKIQKFALLEKIRDGELISQP